jgi:hypothetical protein
MAVSWPRRNEIVKWKGRFALALALAVAVSPARDGSGGVLPFHPSAQARPLSAPARALCLALRGGWLGQPAGSDNVRRQRHHRNEGSPRWKQLGPPAAPVPRPCSVVVRGVAPGVSKQSLIDFFQSAGAVVSLKLLPASPRFPSAVAYVNFGVPDHATAALRHDGAVPSWNAGGRLRVQRQIAPLAPPGPGWAPRRSSGADSLRDSARPAVASPWVQLLSRSTGRHYYVNKFTNESWIQLLSTSTGKYYWFNKVSNKSSWQVPTDVLGARSAASQAAPPARWESLRGEEAARPAVKWGGKAGPDVVGKRLRRLRSTGQWIAGLALECKQIARDRYVHRVEWDSGHNQSSALGRAEWICLVDYRWMLEEVYQEMAAASVRKRTRGRKKDAASGSHAQSLRFKLGQGRAKRGRKG